MKRIVEANDKIFGKNPNLYMKIRRFHIQKYECESSSLRGHLKDKKTSVFSVLETSTELLTLDRTYDWQESRGRRKRLIRR